MKAQSLDFYIVRTPPDEEDGYCPECGLPSSQCEDELTHAALWLTQAERMQAEHENNVYDDFNDEHWDR